MRQKGFTVIDLLAGFAMLASVAILGAAIWAAVHFASKYW